MARGLGVETVYEVNKIAIGDYMPDVTFMLSLSAEEGIRRKKDQKELDRMELESLDFHKKVAEGYISLADRYPERIKVIDASLPINEICDIIKFSVKTILEI